MTDDAVDLGGAGNPAYPSPGPAPLPIAIAREVFGEHFGGAEQYRDVLATQGIDWGLIGPREVDRLWERHLLNSVAIADLIAEGSEVVDVGSGAGLPGIPLAILRPDLRVTLLEPLLRRYQFLTQVVDSLGISERVGVERGRAEDFSGSFDVVTCRAVAPLVKLLPWVLDLRGNGGEILALKGSSAADEVRAASKFLSKNRLRAEVLEVRAHPQAAVTMVVRVRRV